MSHDAAVIIATLLLLATIAAIAAVMHDRDE
jgi:hypothetical protein